MSAILPTLKLDSPLKLLRREFLMRQQINWIIAEDAIHAMGKQAFALAEKSIRIGWTYADALKNVRKRIIYKQRDYLITTKDWPSAVEYLQVAHRLISIYDFTRSIVSHGEEYLKVPRLDANGKPTAFTDEIKVGVIKFDNKSRIIAFSSNPQAMAVYGGDVGIDEFAKHPNAELLWETAQGRVTWGYDLAVWSAHDGEDTLFNRFAREARAGQGPWNLYYRVTMADALEEGLLDIVNKARGTKFTKEEFLASCRARSGQEEIFQQAYMCNPCGAAAAHIVDWSAIERCRYDYPIERIHLEASDITARFGEFVAVNQWDREERIRSFIRQSFPKLFASKAAFRIGFDVAASGQGDLACIYVDEPKGNDLSLQALFTCRTEDWHFLTTVLHCFMRELPRARAAGDATGLGRQICWEAAKTFPGRFNTVNFSSKKHDLGFTLMNQLSVAQKRFPRSHQDIASDFFALRKSFQGRQWHFSEGQNSFNNASHCDIAWAGALATDAHNSSICGVRARVV
jgi:phage FluMu gp28-like protein